MTDRNNQSSRTHRHFLFDLMDTFMIHKNFAFSCVFDFQ